VFVRAKSILPTLLLTAVLIALVGGTQTVTPVPSVRGQSGNEALRVLGQPTLTWDPARAGDAGSAALLAQVFEGLTSLDSNNDVEPALAQSWTVSEDGRHIDFALRAGLEYSDGSPIAAQDVVDSWFRLLDPQRPAPLVSLLSDVAGVTDYLAGRAGRDAVGLHAQTDHILVDLARPATYFVATTTSPSLAVVPPSMFDKFPNDNSLPPGLVVSGAYQPTSATDSEIRLVGNINYWAGKPLLSGVTIVTDTAGQSPVDMFEAGDLDYTGVGSYDAAWIRYDTNLGPQLRQAQPLEVEYYGFDTRTAPFNDPLVRRAFAKAVDWDRIVRLGGSAPAHSMVPPGIAGSDTTDYRPTYDPAAARDLLAQAGFPGGANFPEIALVSNGIGDEPAVAAELQQQLGVKVNVEVLDFSDLLARQQSGEHAKFWNQVWSADYPHANDFLGLLLQTGSASNEGGWSNPDYDADIAAAAAATDPAEQARQYAQAQLILQDQAPVVPVADLQDWALSRIGLLGALPSGTGFLRYAGMGWGSGQ
jgi:oligopeptide transport system substrate-binding protein